MFKAYVYMHIKTYRTMFWWQGPTLNDTTYKYLESSSADEGGEHPTSKTGMLVDDLGVWALKPWTVNRVLGARHFLECTGI